MEWLQEYGVGNGYNEEPEGEGIEDNLRFVDELQRYLRWTYGDTYDAEEIVGNAQLRACVQFDTTLGPRVDLFGKGNKKHVAGLLPGENNL